MDRKLPNPPPLNFGLALAASAAMTLVLTWHLTFYQDTWDYLITRQQITLNTVFTPHNEHIVAIPVLIEQLFMRVFGMTSAKPEYVLLVIALAATAWVFFVYVSRRVGAWPALFASVLVLALGPAWEVLLWPFELCFIGSVLFGIAALLALEREDRRGDIAACLLVILSLGSSSLGLVFLLAAFVVVAQGPREGWARRAFVVVVPGLLFAIWYLHWGHNAESHVSVHNVLASPRYVVEGIAVSLASAIGLGASPYGEAVDPAWGFALLVALAIGIAYSQIKRPGFHRGLWPAVAALGGYWFLAALNEFPGREPTASRYLYAGVILLLMVLANLFREVRPSNRALLFGALALAAILGPNLVILKDAKSPLEEQTAFTRGDTAALEIAKRTVEPTLELMPEVAGTPSLINIYAGPYLEAVEKFGSPAYSEAELRTASPAARQAADLILAKALPLSTNTLLTVDRAPGASECTTVHGGEVKLRPGTTRIELAPGPHASFSLRRFASGEYPVTTEGAPGDSVTTLTVPRDESPQPWYLNVEASQQVRVCR